jgi:hypothetical protein
VVAVADVNEHGAHVSVVGALIHINKCIKVIQDYNKDSENMLKL